MADDTLRITAGECTVRFESHDGVQEEYGTVVVLVKPDNTVLVHDAAGYRPAAWLTRAETVDWTRMDDGVTLRATRNGRRLVVTCHAEHGGGQYTTSRVGRRAGNCPACGGMLVHAAGRVTCLGCDAMYSLPKDAELLDASCESCGLPRIHVTRGETFELCGDRACESLDEAVAERFDREWSCPACGGDLLILRRRGLIAGCEEYPECETGFAIPTGTVDGTCAECSLPAFDTTSGRRCLDATCAGP